MVDIAGGTGGVSNLSQVSNQTESAKESTKTTGFNRVARGLGRALSNQIDASGRSASSLSPFGKVSNPHLRADYLAKVERCNQQRANITQSANKFELEALEKSNARLAKIKRDTELAGHFIALEKFDSDCKITAMGASPEIHKQIEKLKSQNSTREIQDLNNRLNRLDDNNLAGKSQTKPADDTRARRNDHAIAEICLKITKLGGEVNVNAIPPGARRFLDALILKEALEKVDAGRADKPSSENLEAQVAPDTWREPTFEDLEDQLFGDEPGEQT